MGVLRTQISEPARGRRNWKNKANAKKAVYANRRRIRSERGKRLQRQRGEKVERTNAHLYETGAMRRTHLRGHDNIMKRLIVHAAGYNLGLLMRDLFGLGKPKQWRDASKAARAAFFCIITAVKSHLLATMFTPIHRNGHSSQFRKPVTTIIRSMRKLENVGFSTGCYTFISKKLNWVFRYFCCGSPHRSRGEVAPLRGGQAPSRARFQRG